MVWENNFFYLLFLNAITGNVAYILSSKLMKIALKHGNARTVYHLLRGVIIFFSVPFSYIYVVISCFGEVNGKLLSYCGNQYIAEVFHRIFLVWLIITSAIAILYGYRFVKYQRLRAYNIPLFDDKLKELFCSFYPKKRFKGIRMYTNMMCPTPCVMGVLRPILVLPQVPYTREELVIMLAHEAVHIKHRDNLWKTIGRVISVLCWWNPFLHFYMWDLDNWSETYCDYVVCRSILDGDRQRYAKVLVSAAVKSNKYYSVGGSSIATFGDSQTIYRRIKRLSKLNMGKGKRALCILLSAVFVLGSGTTAIAAGEITSVKGEDLYLQTMETEITASNVEVINLDVVDNVNVFSMSAEELAAEGYEIVSMESESGIATYGTQKVFDWDIAASSIGASGNFLKRKDTTIDVYCYITFPSGQSGTARVGVIEPDGTFVYGLCSNNDSVAINYTCERLGYYKVAVQNLRSHSINANGFYVR